MLFQRPKALIEIPKQEAGPNRPVSAAPQGSRGVALLEWTESPVGYGLLVLQQTLTVVVETKPDFDIKHGLIP
ncbi:MAG: hypothetical protein AAFY20_10465 [Cyanobacteria bacterium J06639_14]